MLYPLTFHPILKERVWGGRKLEQLYHKPLPPRAPIGESWEISDRPGDVSVISNGPLAGKDLHWLMEQHERELLGDARSQNGRFPLLIKILDAADKLSLQVHPPANKAAELGGEPKTEMWYITDAAPGAELHVGLKKGITREQFERRLKAGDVAECFHRIPVHNGDAMFLPSGRVHAIGGGLVIFEIQQNSDTTYRVFDWNRAGLDGKPRELHVEKSLASIDFDDIEPSLVKASAKKVGESELKPLAKDRLFDVDWYQFKSATSMSLKLLSKFKIIGVLEKQLVVAGKGTESAVKLGPGQFCLVPAGLNSCELLPEAGASFLSVQAGD